MGHRETTRGAAQAPLTPEFPILRSILLLMTLFCSSPLVQAQTVSDLRALAQAQLGHIEAVGPGELSSARVQLGQSLFWDPRLSLDGQTSCASCHIQENAGSDPRPLSVNARGGLTSLHSVTVFNAQDATAGLRWFADRPTGADQAIGSITGSMGFANRDDILPVLRAAGYEPAFSQAFADETQPLSTAAYGEALEAYQRTLRTPAPFDAWLQGDEQAMSALQREGLQQFLALGCASCHNGPLLGGGSLQRFGVFTDYAPLTGSPAPHAGLASVSGNAEDQFRFRVSPLRNVAATPPYFHDGSVPELTRAIDIMARTQLGLSLPPDVIASLEAFLHSLTGPQPVNFAPPASWPDALPTP